MKLDKDMRETAIKSTIPGLRDMSKLIMDNSDDFQAQALGLMMTLSADLIQDLHEENAELRAQLVAFQKAANPAVAVDPAAPDGERTCHTTFVKGLRVCLKYAPSTRGTIDDTRFDKTFGHLAFVCFDSSFALNRWVAVDLLELVPQPDE
ncbi:hypothetical protein RJV04_001200 [Salmonella enterica]|nr:hypothetical protein [Salmonella enterica]